MTAKEAFEKICESENLGRNEWWIYWPFFKAGVAYQKKQDSRPSAESADAGEWVPWKPGDALPARGAYLVCTKYNTGRPRDPIARMETSRHTDDVAAWNDYTVAYWSIPLPPPPYQAIKDSAAGEKA